jgi:ATP-binding cassette subfamily C protein LapB
MTEVSATGTRSPAAASAGATAPVALDPVGQTLVAWFAGHHARPYSEASVTAALPDGFDGRDPAMLARALATVGLKSRLVLRRLSQIDPVVLPCILFRSDGSPVILTGLSHDRKTCITLDPAAGTPETEIKRHDLTRQIQRDVMLVTPEGDRAESRLAPEAKALGAARRHWFWDAVRANRSAWAQVVIAAFCVNLLSLALPIFVMNVYDRVIPNLAFVTLWTLALGVGLALLLDMALRALRAGVVEGIGRRVDIRASANLFRQAMDVRLLDRPGGAAGIASRIRDFDAVRDFFGSSSFVSAIDLVFIGIFLAALWFIVGPLALVALVAVPVVLILAILAQIPLGRAAAKAQQMAAKRHTVLVESLIGIETVKSLNAEPVVQREWENAVAASSRVGGRGRFWSNVAASGTQLATQLVSVIIIVWGVFLVAEGSITVGALIAANILAGRVLAPLGAITQTIFRTQHAFKAMASLEEFMAIPNERGPFVRSDLRVTSGALEMRKLNYTYPGAEMPALSDFSLSIAAGETLALVGRVGSGKTTLGKMLAGLLQPQSGSILIDGTGILQFDPAELRDGIGYLPQDPGLFTGTLRENLVIGRPRATPDEIRRALYLAAMDETVAALPEGLEHYIGENGNRLSGGQRQGLALARLLLRRPRLLFLDEPSNAMDQQMESRVASRLTELCGAGTGLILCTHRQSLAAIAPRFVVIDKGRKMLDGPRDEVLDRLRSAATASPPARV